MIKTAEFNNDLSLIKSFLETSGFLEDETVIYVAGDTPVIYESGTVNSLIIKDGSHNVLFRAEQVVGNLTYSKMAAYASDSLSGVTTYQGQRSFSDGISCSNGAIVRMMTSNTYYSMLITRANNGKLAFSYSRDQNNSVDYIHCIAFGDVSPLRTINLKTHVRPQRIVAPFLTNSSFDELVYTDKGGWMPYNADYTCNLRAILINGRRFITDGTFAIEDEG